MRTPVLEGLAPPQVEDVLRMDPAELRDMPLQQLHELMRRCGISPLGMDTATKALERLIQRVGISGVE